MLPAGSFLILKYAWQTIDQTIVLVARYRNGGHLLECLGVCCARIEHVYVQDYKNQSIEDISGRLGIFHKKPF